MVLDGVVGVGHAIELAQIVKPRLGHKRLDMALFAGRIARQEPAEGSISFTHTAHLAHGAHKVLGPVRVDAVLDPHHDGSLDLSWFDEEPGYGDVPGSQIQ